MINGDTFGVIVDIRSHREFSKGHIQGAINMPLNTAIEKLRGCENVTIAVHCYHGYDRARPFSFRLANAGYNSIHDIGGFKNLKDGVETAVGAWNGNLPTCSMLHETKIKYVEGEVQLVGVQRLSVHSQCKFKRALSQNVGAVCGTAGDSQCTKNDVTIKSLTELPNRRTGASVKVAWSIKATSTSADSAVATLAALLPSQTFLDELQAKGGDFASVTATTVVTPPSASFTQSEVPTNPDDSTRPSPTPELGQPNEHGVTVVEPLEVKDALSNFDIILDVRSADEFSAGHIPGAINLPGGEGTTALKGCEQQRIAVYCWTGWDRATPLAKKMAAVGFLYVYDLGGMQFMDGVVTEQGEWSGVMPTCAARDADSSAKSMCFYIAIAVAVACLGGALGAWMWCARQRNEVLQEVPPAVAMAMPMDAMDVEKAQAAVKFERSPKPSRDCGGLSGLVCPTGTPLAVVQAPTTVHVGVTVVDETSKAQA